MKRWLLSGDIIDTDYYNALSSYGALLFGKSVDDSTARRTIDSSFWQKSYTPETGSGDKNAVGSLFFQLYKATGREEYLVFGYLFAEDEFQEVTADSLTVYSRFWVDDMYTIGVLQAKAYECLKENKYADRCARHLIAYCEKLQQSNGLFHHTTRAPFFWGRGNGWAAAALTEALCIIPPTHRLYSSLLDAYLLQMHGLLQVQDKNGMWHQVLDRTDSYPETSCTGMFVFAMATGLVKGWLSAATFGPAVETAWQSLSGYVNETGEVTDVCIGTMEGLRVERYLERPRMDGDPHGTAAFLWAAAAMTTHCQNRLPIRDCNSVMVVPKRRVSYLGNVFCDPAGRILFSLPHRLRVSGWYYPLTATPATNAPPLYPLK